MDKGRGIMDFNEYMQMLALYGSFEVSCVEKEGHYQIVVKVRSING